MSRVYIGVGSNIEPERHIPAAIDLLFDSGVAIEASSRFYRTKAIGRPGQPFYANGVWRCNSALEPRELRTLLREIEDRLGRVRSVDKYAPRPIDLDILLYGDIVIADEELVLPDPHILERPFLVRCLLEIDPLLMLPGESTPLSEAGPAKGASFEEHPEVTLYVLKRLENRR